MTDLKKMINDCKIPFLFGLIVSFIITFVTRDYTIPVGWILGSIMGMIVYLVNIEMIDMIISLKKSVLIVMVMHFVKMMLYALALLAGIFMKQYVHLAAVFIALMLPKLTIYWTILGERRNH